MRVNRGTSIGCCFTLEAPSQRKVSEKLRKAKRIESVEQEAFLLRQSNLKDNAKIEIKCFIH